MTRSTVQRVYTHCIAYISSERAVHRVYRVYNQYMGRTEDVHSLYRLYGGCTGCTPLRTGPGFHYFLDQMDIVGTS